MGEQRMPPALAKRFRSGRPCLDFVHTGDYPAWVEPELLGDVAGLERWLALLVGVQAVSAEDTDLVAALELRGSLWSLARARIEGREFAASDVEVVNRFAAQEPPAPVLTAAGALAPLVVGAQAGLSAVARDAIDLFTGPLGHRVRECASEDCGLMFVDSSRPGTRRWCSMNRCGNLAKLRTHRAAGLRSS